MAAKKQDSQITLTDQQISKLKQQPVQQEGGGHFLPGFVVGALVGAAGYFFFGTKKGRKVAMEFQQEWEKHEPELKQKAKEFKIESLLEELKKVAKYLEMKK